MFVEQFALLVLEAAAMAGLVLGLFRARSVLGLSPLYIVMGGFQYLEATLSLQVSLWSLPGRSYAGTLRELAPDTDSVTRTYSARIAVKQPDAALRLGMTASVFAADVDGASAIRLPLTAIHNVNGQPMVWVVDATSAQVSSRAVKLGAAQNDHVLIASGLTHGETVVTAGVHMLFAGQKVKAAGAAQVAMKGQP